MQIVAALAEKRNAQPLPEIGKSHGLRLPPEDACLTAPTWRLVRPAAPAAAAASGGASGAGSVVAGGSGGGPSDMDVDGTAYPWRAGAGGPNRSGQARPALKVNPGEAPDD